MNKKHLSILISILLTLSLVFMTACAHDDYAGQDEEGGQQTSEETADNESTDPAYDYEIEDAEIVSRAAEEKEFYGSWTATSEKAEYLYGNIDLTIKDSKTWKGKVTNISVKGTWEPYEDGIRIKDQEGLIDWKLYYTDDDVLLVEDCEDPGNPIVLTKK